MIIGLFIENAVPFRTWRYFFTLYWPIRARVNLFKNRNVGRKDPVFELSRRVNEYVKKHNRTLEIRGLESVAHECFISAQELKRTPKIPGSNKTRYNLMLPDNSPENKPGRYSAMKKVLSGAG